MRNTKLILMILLISGIVLLTIVGIFIVSISKNRTNKTNYDPNRSDFNTSPSIIDISPQPTIIENEESPADPEFNENVNKDQLSEYPDVFLYNRVPFEDQYFRVEGKPRPEGNPDFSFIVIIKGGNEARSKSAFTEWLRALGLTGVQITSLAVEYR